MKKQMGANGVTVPNLLALNNTAFLPLAVDSFGGSSPSLSMLLHGSPYPNIRPQDWRNASRSKISLLSDKDYKDLLWIKNAKDKYRPPFFPETLLNQLGQANKHISDLRKAGDDNTPYKNFHGTPTQFELRRLSSVVAAGSGNALNTFAHAMSSIVGRGSHDFLYVPRLLT